MLIFDNSHFVYKIIDEFSNFRKKLLKNRKLYAILIKKNTGVSNMITIEEKLKDLILSRYNSIREFALSIGIANSTVDSMLRRGVQNANVSSVIKICNALHISTDALADGEIVFVTLVPDKDITPVPLQIENIVKDFKIYLLSHNLTLEGETLNRETINEFNNFIDLGLDLLKRHNK